LVQYLILTTLPQIQLLDVSNNNLSGPIPKFHSKTRLITRANALLGQNTYEQFGGGGQMQLLLSMMIDLKQQHLDLF